MRNSSAIRGLQKSRGVGKVLAIASAGLLLGACAQAGGGLLQMTAKAPEADKITTSAVPGAAPDNRNELQKATEYWGTAYAKDPTDAKAALNYARNLKAMGEKRQALAVLQAVSAAGGENRSVSGEYGRLALEFDQVSLAQTLLEKADDPTKPDWRIISARGTVFAKQGLYRDAIPFYERALTLAPDQASILSNLALAHTMDGHPDKAEPLLKRAAAAGAKDERVSQNLALVLGVQGKYDEAKLAAARDVAPDRASENVDYVRQIVKLKAKSLPTEVAKVEKPAAEAPAKQAAAKGKTEDRKPATEAPAKLAAVKGKAVNRKPAAEAPAKQAVAKGKTEDRKPTAEALAKQAALKDKVGEDRKPNGWTAEVASKP